MLIELIVGGAVIYLLSLLALGVRPWKIKRQG
jgi:putative peptidoglycan lipid II flippase